MTGVFGLLMIFVFIAKRRMDRNEPIAGWRRRQYLAEQRGEDPGTNKTNESQNRNSPHKNKNTKNESIKDLIGIKDVKFGVFEKTRNEYSIILATDSVNFDLLNRSEQQSIILGYQALFRVIDFPLQILGQAVRHDLRKDVERFRENLKNMNPQTQEYNYKVIEDIRRKSEQDFRITTRIYYVISYIYEPSKMAKLTPAQKERKIIEKLYQQAQIVMNMLNRARITTEILDSAKAIEVLKRAMNRDRMLAHPIDSLIEPGKEKITSFITGDPTSLPLFEDLVQDVDEYNALISESITHNTFEELTYFPELENIDSPSIFPDSSVSINTSGNDKTVSDVRGKGERLNASLWKKKKEKD